MLKNFKKFFILVTILVMEFDCTKAASIPATKATTRATLVSSASASASTSTSPIATIPTTQLNTAKFNLKWTPRTVWQAAPARHITPINSAVNGGDGGGDGGGGSEATIGVPYVIIHHTATRACDSRTDSCSIMVRSMQRYHQTDNGWDDIGYNFLIGGDAQQAEIYEGRGFNVVGAHAGNYNPRSIGIALIGNWSDTLPPNSLLNKLKQLINYGVQAGYIREDYKLLGHRQVRATACPGNKLYNELQHWPHYEAHP